MNRKGKIKLMFSIKAQRTGYGSYPVPGNFFLKFFKKDLCNLHRSFNFRCVLNHGEKPGQPVAVYKNLKCHEMLCLLF